MKHKSNLISDIHTLDLELLRSLRVKPEPFTPGEELFWDDEHISEQMLAAHLNPSNDLASRRPETIDRVVSWLIDTLNLQPGSAVLDLGCGPGLYASRLAQRGMCVIGVDYSHRSIEYAKRYAQENHLDIQYRYENYLELKDSQSYDAALLIYGDFCPLSPSQRSTLLHNVRQALKPGGFFVLDVTTRECRKKHGSVNGWSVQKSGFWKPGPHLLLEDGFDYPEQSIFLDQAITVELDGKVSVYRNWFQDFNRQSITAELEKGGFRVQSVWADLTGQPFLEGGEWIGVIAQT